MKELDVELDPVNFGSGMFFNNGDRFLSSVTANNNCSGIHRLIEHLRFDTLCARSANLEQFGGFFELLLVLSTPFN